MLNAESGEEKNNYVTRSPSKLLQRHSIQPNVLMCSVSVGKLPTPFFSIYVT
jgi:hypothetical protein